ncbi:MAG: hypothetical protein ACQESB_02525 [Elusimicrobiota bacterium]
MNKKGLLFWGSFVFLCLVLTRPAGAGIAPHARALGGAGSSAIESSSPLTLNPALSAMAADSRMDIFYFNRESEEHFASLEYIYPFTPKAALGSGSSLSYNNGENYTVNYIFSLAYRIRRNFALGLSARAACDYSSAEYSENFSSDAGFVYYPYQWLGMSLSGENIFITDEALPTFNPLSLKAGLSLINSGYLRIVSDFHFKDILEEKDESDIINMSGLEISPAEYLKFRAGARDGRWSMGLGVDTKHILLDYAYTPGKRSVHSAGIGIKIAPSASIKEKELKQKSRRMEKKEDYLEAVRDFASGRVASADARVKKYIEKYGSDEDIQELVSDIKNWLDKVRKEKMGRVREIEQEIIKAYYSENISRALVLMDNLKLIAPRYDQVYYLQHLLKARVLLEEGSYEKAEDELVKALRLNPKSQEVIDLHRRLREVLRLKN